MEGADFHFEVNILESRLRYEVVHIIFHLFFCTRKRAVYALMGHQYFSQEAIIFAELEMSLRKLLGIFYICKLIK